MAEVKIYVGKAKIVNTKFGEIIKLNQSTDDLNKMLNYCADNGTKYINVAIQQMKSPDKYGNTHTASIDTWKSDKKETQAIEAEKQDQQYTGNYQKQDERQAMTETQEPTNDLPF